jgi:hypothetical protein
MTRENQKLIETLGDCIAECNNCIISCLNEPNVKMLAHCIKMNMDCVEICKVTLSFVSRDSEHAFQLRDECEEICRCCANECSKHEHMEHCRICAEVCRETAALCRMI